MGTAEKQQKETRLFGNKRNGTEESKRTLLGNSSAVSGGSQVPGYFLVGLLIRLHCHPLKYTSESKSREKSQPPAGPFPLHHALRLRFSHRSRRRAPLEQRRKQCYPTSFLCLPSECGPRDSSNCSFRDSAHDTSPVTPASRKHQVATRCDNGSYLPISACL